MGKFLKFERMITPFFIQVMFWIGFIGSFFAGLALIFMGVRGDGVFGGIFTGLLLIFLGPIAVRIYCEILILAFKMVSVLVEVRDRLGEKGEALSPPREGFQGGAGLEAAPQARSIPSGQGAASPSQQKDTGLFQQSHVSPPRSQPVPGAGQVQQEFPQGRQGGGPAERAGLGGQPARGAGQPPRPAGEASYQGQQGQAEASRRQSEELARGVDQTARPGPAASPAPGSRRPAPQAVPGQEQRPQQTQPKKENRDDTEGLF